MTTWPIWAGSACTSGRFSPSFRASSMPLNASWASSESAISETGWLILIFSGLMTISRPKFKSCRTMFRARSVSRAMSFSFSWRGSLGGALLQHEVREGQYRGQRIVDLVGDAGGQLADEASFSASTSCACFSRSFSIVCSRDQRAFLSFSSIRLNDDLKGRQLVLSLDLDLFREVALGDLLGDLFKRPDRRCDAGGELDVDDDAEDDDQDEREQQAG